MKGTQVRAEDQISSIGTPWVRDAAQADESGLPGALFEEQNTDVIPMAKAGTIRDGKGPANEVVGSFVRS